MPGRPEIRWIGIEALEYLWKESKQIVDRCATIHFITRKGKRISCDRNSETFLDGLGAQRIPDPTTSGDFTRRFDQGSVLKLMEAINAVRQRGRNKQSGDFLCPAFIDIDGTLAGTLGQCKGRMALSYKGV
jgi:hypothetical protein